MALNTSNSSSLEQLVLKGLTLTLSFQQHSTLTVKTSESKQFNWQQATTTKIQCCVSHGDNMIRLEYGTIAVAKVLLSVSQRHADRHARQPELITTVVTSANNNTALLQVHCSERKWQIERTTSSEMTLSGSTTPSTTWVHWSTSCFDSPAAQHDSPGIARSLSFFGDILLLLPWMQTRTVITPVSYTHLTLPTNREV